MKPKLKSYEFKAELKDNMLSGAAAVMGNLDSYRDVIFPGAFKAAIPDFLKRGFVPVGHNWFELPVAMPTKAQEHGNQLLCEAEFHSTEKAQEARTICRERVERGLSVGLSVGFDLDWDDYTQFKDGNALLKYAQDNGYDMGLFDVKGLKAHKGACYGITKVKSLYEFSPVPVPANREALASAVKSLRLVEGIETERDFEEFLRDAGFSRSQSVAIALHGFKARDQREADDEAETSTAPETASASDVLARLLRLQLALNGA